MILKHTALFTILATTVVLAGCNDKDNNSSKIVSPKILKIGSTGQSYPNGFKQNGKLVGFDVETTEAIALNGQQLNFQGLWANLIQAV